MNKILVKDVIDYKFDDIFNRMLNISNIEDLINNLDKLIINYFLIICFTFKKQILNLKWIYLIIFQIISKILQIQENLI